MKAERDKRAAILESEGERQAAINVAEGQKQSIVLSAEADRAQQILNAEGEAKAIEMVAGAKALALRTIGEAAATSQGQKAVQLDLAGQAIAARHANEQERGLLTRQYRQEQQMIAYFNEHQYAFWVSAGFLMLAIEAGVLLFSALGALFTAGLLWLGMLPDTWLAGVACFGVSSGVATMLLWKPLLKLQNFDVPEKDNSSDLIGLRFVVKQTVTLSKPGSTRYSGIDWRIEIAPGMGLDEIEPGPLVAVVSVDAGVFRVVPTET